MRFQIFPFKLGIVLLVIGSIWIGIAYSESNKEVGNFSLESSDSGKLPIKVDKSGIGFYLISSNNYENKILAKVVDSHGNFLDIRKITNKVTVNYFRFEHTNEATLEVTNLSDEPVKLSITIGDTKFQELSVPALMIFFGSSLLVFAGYRRLRLHYSAT